MKQFCILSLTIFFSFTIHSQTQNPNLEFGIKAGANYSKFTPDFSIDGRDYAEYQRGPGFYLGAFLSKKLSEKLYFQPELHFALQQTDFLVKGIEIRTNDPNAGSTVLNVETNIAESVIAIPLILRYYITGSILVEAGPQAGFILDRSEKVENDPFEQPDNPRAGFEYEYDKFDLGLSVGTGYELSKNLIINGRYIFGLVERDGRIKSSVFNLGLEYKF